MLTPTIYENLRLLNRSVNREPLSTFFCERSPLAVKASNTGTPQKVYHEVCDKTHLQCTMELAEPADGLRTSTNGCQIFICSDVADRRVRQNLPDDEQKVDRSRLQLGRRESVLYLTRYGVDARRQLDEIADDVISEDCLPFRRCPRGRRCAAAAWLWSFVRSESFLYALHVAAIALGAINHGTLCLYHTEPIRSIRSDPYGQCVRSPPKSTPDTVSYGQRVRSPRSARTVSTVASTVYTVSCYGHPERYK